MTAAELSKAPQLTVNSDTIEFGKIKRKNPSKKEINVKKKGKKKVEMKSIQPNCSCVTAMASKTSLKPGENSTITISFNPADRSGTQNKAITVYSNDPKNPVQRLIFTAYVQQ